MESTARRLCWHGILLFLLGLITGLAMQQFANPRMGLAAHLEGLMNGLFLLALGAVWHRVRLSPGTVRAAVVTLLYGTYANWAVTSAAAILGTASMTPLASGGHMGASWAEMFVTVGFGSVALAMLSGCLLVLWGFRGRGEPADQAEA